MPKMPEHEEAIAFFLALNPTREQENALNSHLGAARYAYNWAYNLIEDNYKARQENPEIEKVSINHANLRRKLNEQKDGIAPWWNENSKSAFDSGLVNVCNAYDRFFKGQSKHPKPKKKNPYAANRGGITFDSNLVPLKKRSKNKEKQPDNKHLTLPRIGKVRLYESARKLRRAIESDGARVTKMTVSYQRDQWFVSVSVRVTREFFLKIMGERSKRDRKVVGSVYAADLGLSKTVVGSDGITVENEKRYRKLVKKLKRAQRVLSRRQGFNKKTGEVPSNRYLKQKQKVTKLYAKMSNQELEVAHQFSNRVVHSFENVVLEDLNVKGMMSNHRLALAVSHASFGRVKEFVKYKAEWFDSKLWLVDRWFPSSKLCSDCGLKKANLPLSERVFRCDDPECGLILDRDENAVRNLLRFYYVAQSCGETLNGRGGTTDTAREFTLSGVTTGEALSAVYYFSKLHNQ